MPPRLIDIARDSNLSTAVVSSVLNGGSSRIRFSRETRQKVFRSAKKLGYKIPSTGGIGLLYCGGPARSKERNWIGFISPMLTVLQNRCNDNGQLLAMYCYSAEELSEDLRQCKLPQILRRRNTDGLVVMGTVSPELIDGIHEINMPYVMMNINESDAHAENAVFFDDVFTGTIATNYLLDRGRKRILHVSADWNNHYSIRQRRQGYEQALGEQGLSGRMICHSHNQHEAFQKELKTILSCPDRPDAIFTYCDSIARLCHRVYLDLGLNYRDVAMMTVEFEDRDATKYLGDTCVKLPAAEMVNQAYLKLEKKMQTGEDLPTVSLRGTICDAGSVPPL